MVEELIRLEHIAKTFSRKRQRGQVEKVNALADVSLAIFKGETLGLVGESGSGKTTLGRIILGLETKTSGKLYIKDKEISRKKDYQSLHQLQVIFQDPYSALNPRLTALAIVREPVLYLGKQQATQKAIEILKVVGITGDAINKRPHEFSGGQRQRIGIARAVVSEPEFIVCDEPTSALDVIIQEQILKLLKDLQDKLHLSYLFITHDLSVVQHISDRIAVMYRGHLVELGPVTSLFTNPQHPYTKYLLSSKLELDPKLARQKRTRQSGEFQDRPFSDAFDWLEVSEGHFYRKEKESL